MPSDLIRGWRPVRVKKTRRIKNLEPRFDSIEKDKARAIEQAHSAPIRMRKSGTHSCRMDSVFGLLGSSTPGSRPRARCLAAIGNLFVFHRLSFVERGKASFLDRRNMNENVLAAARGLDKSEALGRVEPLHSTFSHHVVSAGSKTIANCRSPHTAMPDARTIRDIREA